MLKKLKQDLRKESNKKTAEGHLRFFKTGKGQYGEGDIFLGIRMPDCRKIAKKYNTLNFKVVCKLLRSKFHEERMVALLILINRFKKSDKKIKKEIYDIYLANIDRVNNWDLVDVSADKIAGAYLEDKDRSVLYKLAKSDNLWEKRISIISTHYFIRLNQFEDTLKIALILINDRHDLIHKAVGWMLREVGNRNRDEEEKFLKKHYKKMPRTALRYSIEKFPKDIRQWYLKKS
ncbi:MAG: DNA alkylation repair protein [Elusimicrobia bacterium]|nr:DNA alkylation repair protein [Elusimicrobiota bacterium]